MNPAQVRELLAQTFPDAKIYVGDLTGTGDHFQAEVVSDRFTGLNTIKQHRLVYGALQAYIDSGELHALQLKTYSPQQWQQTRVQIEGP
ncbi:BolA family protein [Synechococcus sp. PCC 7336]|uniref:BolA family protein n=1 Tax=Synechococcus sp. PCC 7336 TaxID=195250 RepID=UPI000344ED8C|nr:BolA/IbaG family iron-sulfur metabolism protein [Synechococcus sp. PCC 7336]